MAYVIHENQLQDVLKDLMEENQWVPVEDIIKWINSNPDIKIMKSWKIWDTQSISDWAGWKTSEEIEKAFWVHYNDKWELEQKKEVSQEKKSDYSLDFDKNKYENIWKNAVSDFDITDPLMDNAKRLSDWYRELWKEKNNITDKYNSWQSWDKEFYKKKLDIINEALRAAETSPEFKSIIESIRENWAAIQDELFHPMVAATLESMALWAWSRMWDKDWESFQNRLEWDLLNSNAARALWPVTRLKNLPTIYDNTVWKIEEQKKRSTPEWLEASKRENFRKKNPNVDIKKTTDKMLFWDEAANSWVDNYINIRDDKLATLLKVKWAESPEEIDEFLSQYPSWQNAKQQWKDETLKRLSEKMSNVKYDDFAKQVKDAKAKNESKEEKKVWDDWTPSNDDSINGVEKENTIYDGNGKAIWVKHLDIKKKKPSTLKKITDFLEGNKKISKEDLYSVLPDKAKQLIDWIDKEAKARLNAKEHIWDTDEDWYRDPDSPINWTEEEDVESTNEKWWKWTSKKETKQTSKNNKFLYITKEVQKLKPTERIKYLKENWFTVDKNWYFTRNWMKTLVYKDGQYNPKYVKPNKEEWYNDRTKVEPTSPSKLQIALQKSWYQWPRDANGNFLPMTDKWLDIQEGKKNLKDKSKK